MSQQYSQKYTVVCFLDPQDKLTNFSSLDWPLHVTILDTFKTNWQLSELCQALRDVAAKTASFDTVPIQSALLGEHNDVPVKLLPLDEPMSTLHYALLGLVDGGSFVFNTPEFVGSGFLPHVTDQRTSQVSVGESYDLTGISLVDMFPDNDHTRREIVETFNFIQ